MVIPGKKYRIVEDQRADRIAPRRLGITELWNVATDPDQVAIVRIAGNVGVAEGDIDGVRCDGRRVDREVRLFMRSLIDPQTEVMPPQLIAVRSIQANEQ